VFDPFRDYETAGYLRNFQGEKDLEIVKVAEHDLFKAQLPSAMQYLAGCKHIEYENFLKVHEILFSGLYPWAGQDRPLSCPIGTCPRGRSSSVTLSIAGGRSRTGFRTPKREGSLPLAQATSWACSPMATHSWTAMDARC